MLVFLMGQCGSACHYGAGSKGWRSGLNGVVRLWLQKCTCLGPAHVGLALVVSNTVGFIDTRVTTFAMINRLVQMMNPYVS